MDKWRKKESYNALTRFLLGSPSGYKQWDCFLFSDYTERAASGRTFEVRHLPLSDGNDAKNFGGALQFDWARHSWSPAKSKSKSDTLVKTEPVAVTAATTPSAGGPMIWDVELDKLVSYP